MVYSAFILSFVLSFSSSFFYFPSFFLSGLWNHIETEDSRNKNFQDTISLPYKPSGYLGILYCRGTTCRDPNISADLWRNSPTYGIHRADTWYLGHHPSHQLQSRPPKSTEKSQYVCAPEHRSQSRSDTARPMLVQSMQSFGERKRRSEPIQILNYHFIRKIIGIIGHGLTYRGFLPIISLISWSLLSHFPFAWLHNACLTSSYLPLIFVAVLLYNFPSNYPFYVNILNVLSIFAHCRIHNR